MADHDIPYPTNDEIARILFRIASLLEMTQDNIYRVRAYRRAALGVVLLKRPVADFVLDGERPPLPGVGDRIHNRIRELVNTGHMGVYEALLDELGEPLASLLALHGVGPRTAVRLVEELQIASLEDLAQAARAHRVQRLRGFGPKREASLGEQAESLLDGAAA
ncbi:MAG TPA: helix-hairpin-helix domain-containing protein [Chloroflexota bacterium]|nr:helix-hairpin-helix domain-containing protein [Chloroflexota bacterium]